jgi:hypothetical protein
MKIISVFGMAFARALEAGACELAVTDICHGPWRLELVNWLLRASGPMVVR